MSHLRMPAEWEHHDAVWLAWPSDAALWQHELAPAQESFLRFCETIADVDPSSGVPRGEELRVLVCTEAERMLVEEKLRGLAARVFVIPYGDIWLRDTAPIFVRDASHRVWAACFQFNGWGGKYVLEHDAGVAELIVARSGVRGKQFPWVLEGGAVEVDGLGTCLTTKQCLLNANRNPSLDREQLEERLFTALGATSVLWVTEGLRNDHTDGHIDTIARFVAPGVVVCMRPSGDDDPNADVLRQIEAELRSMQDARGKRLEVVTVPSPGLVQNEDGEVMPASYVNFYIANTTVVVPTYGSPYDAAAVEEIARLFPTRRTVGIACKPILAGGGAFHCISQQQPAAADSYTR